MVREEVHPAPAHFVTQHPLSNPEPFKQKVSPSKDAIALVCNAKGCQPGRNQACSDRHIGAQENSALHINSPAPPVSSQPLFLGYCAIAWNACSTAKGI